MELAWPVECIDNLAQLTIALAISGTIFTLIQNLVQNPEGTDCLDKFKTKRRIIIGSNLPRTVRISRGASIIETGGGLIYSGLGLGMFLMLSTRENFEVSVEVFILFRIGVVAGPPTE